MSNVSSNSSVLVCYSENVSVNVLGMVNMSYMYCEIFFVFLSRLWCELSMYDLSGTDTTDWQPTPLRFNPKPFSLSSVPSRQRSWVHPSCCPQTLCPTAGSCSGYARLSRNWCSGVKRFRTTWVTWSVSWPTRLYWRTRTRTVATSHANPALSVRGQFGVEGS